MSSGSVATFWIKRSQDKYMENERERRMGKPKCKRRLRRLFCCFSNTDDDGFMHETEVVEGHWEIPYYGQQSRIPSDGQILQQIRSESDLWESVSADIPYRCMNVQAEVHWRPEEALKSLNLDEEAITSHVSSSPLTVDCVNNKILAGCHCTRENLMPPHISKIISDYGLRLSKMDCDCSKKGSQSTSSIINYPGAVSVSELTEIDACSNTDDAALSHRLRQPSDYTFVTSSPKHQEIDCCCSIVADSSLSISSDVLSKAKRKDILSCTGGPSQMDNVSDFSTFKVKKVFHEEDADGMICAYGDANSQKVNIINKYAV